jgi:hypothetical protein
MKIHKYLKAIPIIAYFLIFLQGMIIQLPFIFVLLSGPFEGEAVRRILISLADIALIGLLVISFLKKTKWLFFLQSVIYLILLLPLIYLIGEFPFRMFNNFLFLFPTAFFIIFYPLSIIYSYRDFSKREKSSDDQ